MSVTDAVEGLSYQQVRSYLMRIQKISTPGKGLKQLITTISERDNVGIIIKHLNKLKQNIADLKTEKPKKSGASKRKRDINDDGEDDEEAGDEAGDDKAGPSDNSDEDDAMIMLKEELALRGLTTKGNSYPFLVKRLVKALRDDV